MAGIQRDHIPINIESLASSFEDDMRAGTLFMSANCCIFRTPKILYRHNQKAYHPNAFSIGPFHHDKEQLKPTNKIKLKYLQGFLSRSSVLGPEEELRQLIKHVTEVEEEARKYYAGPINCSVDEFVKIMVLDGCFIVELFRKDANEVPKDADDPIFTMSCLLEFLNHDLILLENQIPWLVLERLFDLTMVPEGKSLFQLALDFFGNIFSYTKPSIKPDQFRKRDIKIKHILDLLRYSLTLPLEADHPDMASPDETYSEWETLPCAAKIQEAGIKFRKVSAESILDIRFQNGVLEIPRLLVQETTESILRNLISFEQCCPNYPPIVTSYAKLMDNLIDTSKDVEILCDNNIIDNWLNPEDATQFFNKLHNDTYVKRFYHFEVCKSVKNYRERWWPKWRTFYIHNYFATPWAIVSQVVGTIFLILGILQTLYSILSVVKN